MKKRIIAGVLGALLALPALGETTQAPQGYQLRQVLVMSRHNLRAPLANNGSILEQSTPHPWPKWEVPGGQLTTKGGVLEIYMGRYLRQWLGQQGLVKAQGCPDDSQAYFYANSLQRTVATAQFFAAGAFPGCNIQIHHQAKMGTMDPVFNPVVTRDDPAFSKTAASAMANQRSRYALDESFKLLEQIADYKDSPACKQQHQCDLSGAKDRFTARLNQEPGVSGPLKVGNSLVDAFTLQYYEGFPEQQVAWGEIKSDRQWQLLSALKNSYQESLFAPPEVARNVAAPLIKYIDKTLEAPAGKAPPLTVMVGHDSNIASLLSALDFRPYQLPGQYEHTPIGGKLVFQRWHDARANRELMKVEYVYQSGEQLRKAQPLSLENPPQRVTLELSGCPSDDNGFCPMDKFTEVMRQAMAGN